MTTTITKLTKVNLDEAIASSASCNQETVLYKGSRFVITDSKRWSTYRMDCEALKLVAFECNSLSELKDRMRLEIDCVVEAQANKIAKTKATRERLERIKKLAATAKTKRLAAAEKSKEAKPAPALKVRFKIQKLNKQGRLVNIDAGHDLNNAIKLSNYLSQPYTVLMIANGETFDSTGSHAWYHIKDRIKMLENKLATVAA